MADALDKQRRGRGGGHSVFVRYVLSGGVAAATHLSILVSLVELADLNKPLASAIGFIAAICVNYTLQYQWAFVSNAPHRSTFPRYMLVTLSMLGVNTVLFCWMTEMMGVPYVPAQVFAIAVVFLMNFYINRNYTFVQKVV